MCVQEKNFHKTLNVNTKIIFQYQDVYKSIICISQLKRTKREKKERKALFMLFNGIYPYRRFRLLDAFCYNSGRHLAEPNHPL